MVNLMAQLVRGLPNCYSTEKFDWSGNLKEFSLTPEPSLWRIQFHRISNPPNIR